MKYKNQTFNKILIIGCRLIGDAVLTLPGIRAIGKAYPNAVIDILSTKTTEEIYTNPDFVHDFIPYSQNFSAKKQVQTIRRLRRNRYDAAILYSGSFNAALIAFLSRIKTRVGTASDYRSFLLSDKVKIKSPDMHQRDVYKEVTALINVGVDKKALCYDVDPESKADVSDMLKKDGLKKGGFIVINPTASEKNKIWPGFAEWINEYVKVKNNRVILVGARADKSECQKLMNDSGGLHVYNWAGKLKIRQTAALLSMAGFYLGNNSGIMHLAASVGCRAFAVSGHSNLKKTRPYTKFHSIVYTDIFCRPCFNKKLKRCSHAACINSIKTADVSRMIEKGIDVIVKPDIGLLNKRWIRKQKKYEV